MEKKKDNIWKKIGLGIIGVFTGIIALLLGGHIRGNRDRTKPTRDNIERAEAANRDAEVRVEQLKDRTEHAAELNNDLERCNDECQSIINNIRKRNKKR